MAKRLPDLPYEMRKNKSEIVAMRGINFSDMFEDGDLSASKNISARRYPYIATRRAREVQDGYSGCTALTAWGKLVAVCGEKLYYDGNEVGSITAGEKQFVVVNTKLVIWPDKVYLDLNTLELVPLADESEGTGAEFTTNTLTIAWAGVDLTEHFKVGDGIIISGCTVDAGNNKDIIIKDLTATTITVTDDTFTAATETGTITLSRDVPDMDYICESENRLWGCSSSTQTIYVSALGDPTNFNVFQGLSTDSYAVAVGSEGDFTGCCRLSSSVLFWKQNKLHKMLGSFPAEYSLYTYDIEGLRDGCYKSLQVINEVLFYMGLHGIYAYTGGTPSLVSMNFGEHQFTNAIAGNDGDSYYLSVKDGDAYRLLVYETRSGIWVHEDDIRCVDFARVGKDMYFADSDGKVWLADNGDDDPDIEWYIQFTPFMETIEGRKVYSKMLIRTELPAGSYMIASVRQDEGTWREVGRITGRKKDVVPMRIPLTRCDRFEIRLSGKGPMAILSVLREFGVGSEV